VLDCLKQTTIIYSTRVQTQLMLCILFYFIRSCSVAQAAGQRLGYDLAREVARSPSDPMTACYIDSAFPAMLFFAHKYSSDGIEALLLASTNAGGENVARGSLLGALAGAAYGVENIPEGLVQGLVAKDTYLQQADLFLQTFVAADK
jgi:ADP-ribosylglycohydrolase